MRILLLTSLLMLSSASQAASLVAGYKNVGVKLGSSSIGPESYTVVGASLNYFVIDNLSLGGAYEYWFSGEPTVSKATVDATYFIPVSEKVRPYLGALYSRYFIDDFNDINSYGYRAGVAFINGPVLLSGGVRQEYYDSDSSVFDDSDNTAELVIGFSF